MGYPAEKVLFGAHLQLAGQSSVANPTILAFFPNFDVLTIPAHLRCSMPVMAVLTSALPHHRNCPDAMMVTRFLKASGESHDSKAITGTTYEGGNWVAALITTEGPYQKVHRTTLYFKSVEDSCCSDFASSILLMKGGVSLFPKAARLFMVNIETVEGTSLRPLQKLVEYIALRPNQPARDHGYHHQRWQGNFGDLLHIPAKREMPLRPVAGTNMERNHQQTESPEDPPTLWYCRWPRSPLHEFLASTNRCVYWISGITGEVPRAAFQQTWEKSCELPRHCERGQTCRSP